MESVYEGTAKFYIVINEYGRARLMKAPTAKEAVERYEKDHLHKVVMILEQPNYTGNHVDVWETDRSLRLVRMGS